MGCGHSGQSFLKPSGKGGTPEVSPGRLWSRVAVDLAAGGRGPSGSVGITFYQPSCANMSGIGAASRELWLGVGFDL